VFLFATIGLHFNNYNCDDDDDAGSSVPPTHVPQPGGGSSASHVARKHPPYTENR
jgi:hypothetical protein